MRGRSRRSEERFNVWPGFTDVMVGLLLIFVLVVTLFTISETILGRSLSKKDIELARLKREAIEKTLEIERLQNERDVKIAETESLTQDIAKRIEEIETLSKEAAEKAERIEKLRSDVAGKEKEIESLRQDIAQKTEETDRLMQQLAVKAEEAQNLLWQNELKGGALERLKVEIDRLEHLAADQRTKIAGLEDLFAGRTKELETALAEIQSKSELVQEKDKLLEQRLKEVESALAQLKEKTTQLSKRGTELAGARGEILKKAQSINDLTAALEAQNKRIIELNRRIADYAKEVNRLNGLLAEAKESEAKQKTKAASLQNEIVSLRSKLEELGTKLSSAEEETKKKFRISQLVGLLGEKEKEIERLRKLAKYRSEFLAKLESVFSGVPDIKVQGDRFVFQSEILFASGSSTINEEGKKELDKFIRIYKEMESKVPKDLDLIILVQGHTDTDPVRATRYRSNWELSAERALQVVRYMIEKGVPPTVLGASALGEFHPVSKKDSLADKRLNRRIEIKITTL